MDNFEITLFYKEGGLKVNCSELKLTKPFMSGDNVKALQIALEGRGYEFGPTDGIFGPLTAGAVEMWKAYTGVLPVDSTVTLDDYYALGVRCVGTMAQTEQLDFNDPLHQGCETVWFNEKKYWAFEFGRVEIDPSDTKYAEEFMITYGVSREGEPDLVPLQLNIYDSIPGMDKYSPIWHLNYVIVPSSYVPNTIRSAHQALTSGYDIIASNNFVN